jgi:glycosyltransferase involved in cell wall biosynthesis
MDNIEYTICRYELYPPDFHTAIAVGFLVKDISTGNTGTMEKLIPLEDSNGKNQGEVCNLAFSRLTTENQNLLDYFQKKRDTVVGSVFIPSYGALLSTFLEESLNRNVVVIPKCYSKISDKFKNYFDNIPNRDGTEKELLLFPSFNYPDIQHPLLHILNGKNKTFFSMWEASRIGDFYIDKINIFDQVIVPNKWNKETFENQGCTSKISVINLGVDTNIFNYTEPNNNDIFTFATGNDDPRKRLPEVIKCFIKAFPNEKDVRLSIKISNQLSQRFSDNRIVINTQNLTKQELKNWYCSTDVFVSAVSAEGWGLMQHESMACGRPVIVANYGGLKEFVTLENSFCLRHIEVDATGFWEFPGAKWSRYDEEHMIETMRYCYNNRDKVKEKGIIASKDACKLSNELFIQTLLKTLSIDF